MNCFICGEDQISHDSTIDAKDINNEKNGLIQYFKCHKCKSEYEVFEPFEEESEE